MRNWSTQLHSKVLINEVSMKKNQILVVMNIAMILGYMPWYNFSAVLKYLSVEFHLSTSDIGWILAAFQGGYVISSRNNRMVGR